MYYNTKASGARIRELRLAKKLDQIELAELLNVSHGYISRIESGKKGCSVDLMIQISEIFGTSLDYLILGKCNGVPDFIRQIGNPYCYRHGKYVVKVSFADTDISLEDRLEAYIRTKG